MQCPVCGAVAENTSPISTASLFAVIIAESSTLLDLR